MDGVWGKATREKRGNSLFFKVKESTIANCWDKMEIRVKGEISVLSRQKGGNR